MVIFSKTLLITRRNNLQVPQLCSVLLEDHLVLIRLELFALLIRGLCKI